MLTRTRNRASHASDAARCGFHRGERGQAIVETALVLPIIVLLLFGILEFGRFYNAWIVITQASREGARVAAVECSLSPSTCGADVDSKVDANLGGLSLASRTITLTAGPYSSGSPVTVTVQYRMSVITPIIATFMPGNPFTLTSSATMRLE